MQTFFLDYFKIAQSNINELFLDNLVIDISKSMNNMKNNSIKKLNSLFFRAFLNLFFKCTCLYMYIEWSKVVRYLSCLPSSLYNEARSLGECGTY